MNGSIGRQAVVASVALAGAGVALAQAEEPINPDRPGIADGSKVLGHGRLQIEVAHRGVRGASRGSPIAA